MKTFSYRIYGLAIQSEIPLPELVATESPPDVRVRLGRVDGLPPHRPGERLVIGATPDEIRIRFDAFGLLVRGGVEIIADCSAGGEARSLRRLILGPGLALLLHQRGLLVLHASAVTLDGDATAFLGRSGQGKSTTAAALQAQGHPLVTDDVLPVRVDASPPLVAPGSPQQKLWPDVVASLGDVPEDLPLVDPCLDKRLRRVNRVSVQAELPLRRIYVLDDAGDTKIEQLAPRQAFEELVRNSYVVQVPGLLDATDSRALHFRQCARLSAAVRMFRVGLKRSLEALPELAQLIARDHAE